MGGSGDRTWEVFPLCFAANHYDVAIISDSDGPTTIATYATLNHDLFTMRGLLPVLISSGYDVLCIDWDLKAGPKFLPSNCAVSPSSRRAFGLNRNLR